MSEAGREATAEEWAAALCARWGMVYGPATDSRTAAEIQRELAGALQAAIERGRVQERRRIETPELDDDSPVHLADEGDGR